MFQATRAMFIYCVSPLHMGAGTTLGLIDNPIQRERHTDYPMCAGSGLKGALRHHLGATWDKPGKPGKERLLALFGPEPGRASDHAGALSLGDAMLVAYPVRCLERAYVYATSATALARAARALSLAKIASPDTIPKPGQGQALIADDRVKTGESLILEAYKLGATVDEGVKAWAEWLAENALPAGDAFGFFREKIAGDLVVLPDDDFGFLVKSTTVVEPHVRIDDASGTADAGGLFYTENLPPESLLLSIVMASPTRRPKNGDDRLAKADGVIDAVVDGGDGFKGLDGATVQIGGDATDGRGLAVLNFVGGKRNGT